MASVAVWATGTGGHSATTYSIDANGFTIPIGAFTTASSLTVGQTVQVTVEAGTLQLGPVSGPITQGGWGPPQKLSFTASNLQLEPSQLTATVSALTGYLTVPGSSTFTVENFPSIFSGPWFPIGPVNSQTVITTPQTTWQGFDPESFAGLADNDVVSVSGWFFPPIVFDNIAPQYDLPIVVAQSVTLHSNGRF